MPFSFYSNEQDTDGYPRQRIFPGLSGDEYPRQRVSFIHLFSISGGLPE